MHGNKWENYIFVKIIYAQEKYFRKNTFLFLHKRKWTTSASVFIPTNFLSPWTEERSWREWKYTRHFLSCMYEKKRTHLYMCVIILANHTDAISIHNTYSLVLDTYEFIVCVCVYLIPMTIILITVCVWDIRVDRNSFKPKIVTWNILRINLSCYLAHLYVN